LTLSNRSKVISFYSEQLGKKISGTYSLSGRMVIVTTSDGRQRRAPAGGGKPETLARLALIELEAANSDVKKLVTCQESKKKTKVAT
jgi:predicted RNA-binding protein with PIN domain